MKNWNKFKIGERAWDEPDNAFGVINSIDAGCVNLQLDSGADAYIPMDKCYPVAKGYKSSRTKEPICWDISDCNTEFYSPELEEGLFSFEVEREKKYRVTLRYLAAADVEVSAFDEDDAIAKAYSNAENLTIDDFNFEDCEDASAEEIEKDSTIYDI